MKAKILRLLEKAHGLPEKRLLWINVGMACFVGLSHGGALALTYVEPSPFADSTRRLASFSLPLVVLFLITSTAALLREDWRRPVLGLQGVVLASSAIVLSLWVLDIVVNGLPGGNLSFSMGFLSVWVGYSVLVACRFSLPPELRSHPTTYLAPLVALAITAIVELGLLIRFIAEMTNPIRP